MTRKGASLLRQRNELDLVARHLAEVPGLPLGLGLLDALLRDDTKFHQMWRGPSMGAPPTITTCASVTAFTVNLSPGLNTRSCPGANVSPAISIVPSTR